MRADSGALRIGGIAVVAFALLTWLTLPPGGKLLSVRPVDPETGRVIFGGEQGTNVSTENQKFDTASFSAEAFVDDRWEDPILPWLRENAVDIGALATALADDREAALEKYAPGTDATATPSVAVTGTGTVESVDVSTPRGRATVALEGDHPSGPETVTLSLGKLVISSALRDALPFFSLNDFTNQVQYADVSEALNDRAIAASVPEDPATLEGARVRFVGATALSGNDWEITPAVIEVQQ